MSFEDMQSSAYLFLDALPALCYFAAAMAGTLGMFAIGCPKDFRRLCNVCDTWIKTPLQIPLLDDRVAEPERIILSYTRLTGAAMLGLAIVLTIVTSGL